MGRKLRLAAALALATAGAPALATNGMRMIGFGPVQGSMGGVGVGATLDSCSVLSNPAGLTELGRRLDVGLSWFKPTVDYKASESPLPPGFGGAVVAQPDKKIDSDRGGSPIPAIGFVIPVGPNLAAGVGVFGVAGMGVDYPVNLYGGRTYSSYLQARLTPAIAYRFNDQWSAGLTINAMAAQMKYDVAAGFGQVAHDTATSFGYGATVGLQFRPSKEVSVGVAYETKSTFQDFSFDVPAHSAVDPVTFTPVPVPGGKDKLKFDQPAVATAGFAIQATEAVLVAADLEWIQWSDTNGKSQPKYTNDTNQTGAMPWNLSWSDQWVVKLGAQVAATPQLKVRVGYNYGKDPLDRSRAFENIAFPAIAEHHFTAGLGYSVGDSLIVNLGGMYAPQASLTGANPTYPAQGGQAIAFYTTSMSQYQIDAGVSYRF
jgi:long-chain fatty acid transport protein